MDWERAAESKIDSPEAIDTCEIVFSTDEMRPLNKMWVLKTKTNADGNIERYKAPMVVYTKVRRSNGHDDWEVYPCTI